MRTGRVLAYVFATSIFVIILVSLLPSEVTRIHSDGVVVLDSLYTFDETVTRMQQILERSSFLSSHSLSIAARDSFDGTVLATVAYVKFAGPTTRQLILDRQSVLVELPQRIAVTRDKQFRKVQVAIFDTSWMQKRHHSEYTSAYSAIGKMMLGLAKDIAGYPPLSHMANVENDSLVVPPPANSRNVNDQPPVEGIEDVVFDCTSCIALVAEQLKSSLEKHGFTELHLHFFVEPPTLPFSKVSVMMHDAMSPMLRTRPMASLDWPISFSVHEKHGLAKKRVVVQVTKAEWAHRRHHIAGHGANVALLDAAIDAVLDDLRKINTLLPRPPPFVRMDPT
ncbi:MAG: hypothetical protein MHM6MM_000416 [Cercozoa sp. M6MM]